jgi:hypothetical protein
MFEYGLRRRYCAAQNGCLSGSDDRQATYAEPDRLNDSGFGEACQPNIGHSMGGTTREQG